MGSRSIGERIAIARRIAGVAACTPSDVALVHTDLLPRALVERVLRSIAAFAPIVDRASGESLGVAECGAPAWDVEDRDALGRIAVALLGPSAFTFVEPAPSLPDVAELALFEFRKNSGSIRLYVDPRRLIVRDAPKRTAVDLPITVSIEIASTTLVRRELRALALGDVVTLDHVHPGAPIGRIPGADRAPRFTLASGELRFEGALDPAGDSMDHDDDDTLVRIDEAHVTLSVELARIATTVGELSGLVRGALFATGLPEAREVTLRLHGRAVARGELVLHDGELAVRIVELANGDQ